MADCELLYTCPFFNDGMHSEMPEMYKEQYCKGDYSWCGRYLIFKTLERKIDRELPRYYSYGVTDEHGNFSRAFSPIDEPIKKAIKEAGYEAVEPLIEEV